MRWEATSTYLHKATRRARGMTRSLARLGHAAERHRQHGDDPTMVGVRGPAPLLEICVLGEEWGLAAAASECRPAPRKDSDTASGSILLRANSNSEISSGDPAHRYPNTSLSAAATNNNQPPRTRAQRRWPCAAVGELGTNGSPVASRGLNPLHLGHFSDGGTRPEPRLPERIDRRFLLRAWSRPGCSTRERPSADGSREWG